MTPPDRIRFEHLVEAAEKAVSYAEKRSRASPTSCYGSRSPKLVEIVGEAAK